MNIWRRSNNSDYTSVASDEMASSLKEWPCWKHALVWSGVALLVLLILAVLTIWVIFPLIFMNTYSLQRFVVFWNVMSPKDAVFTEPERYGAPKSVNFYLNVTDLDGVSKLRLGAWLVVPEKDMNTTEIPSHDTETAVRILKQTDMPIAIVLHGVYATRAKVRIDKHRKVFMPIIIDHRGYGDSDGEPSEDGIISDSVQIFKWIRQHTKNDIYVWGHSLGCAIATHFVRSLKEENIVPKGVIIESAYTSLRDEVPENSIGRLFSWLPYFEATVLNPLWNNRFRFVSVENILYCDSPLLMMHAEDDNVIPVKFGRRLADVAKTQRNLTVQGSVKFIEFPAILGYSHVGIPQDAHLVEYLIEFQERCKRENKNIG